MANVFNTVSDLATQGANFSHDDIVYSKGNAAVGDGRHSVYRLDTSGDLGAGAENGDTIVATNGPANSYFLKLDVINNVTPEHFDAVGDGVADDTTAVQSALDTGTCWLRQGSTYKITARLDLDTAGGVKLVGPGKLLVSGSLARVIYITASDTTIDGITLEGSATGSGNETIRIGNGTNEINDVVIQNCSFIDIADANVDGIETQKLVQGSISNNNFDGFVNRVMLINVGTENLAVIGNVLNDNGGQVDNGAAHTIDMNSQGDAVTNNIISGNTIQAVSGQMHFEGPNVYGNVISHNTILVTGTSTSANGMKFDRAGHDDTVNTSPNLIMGNMIISPGWGILEAGGNHIIGNTIRAYRGIGLTVSEPAGSEDKSWIEGNVIRAKAAHGAIQDGIAIGTDGHTIINNYIEGFLMGIQDNSSVTDLVIIGNHIERCEDSLIELSGDDHYVAGNVLRDAGTANDAITCTGDNCTVVDNQIYGSVNMIFGGAGLYVRHDDPSQVTSLAADSAGVITGGSKETVTSATPALATSGTTLIDSTSNAVNGTLANGVLEGQRKLIRMTNASNSSTVSVTTHETSSPEVFTFDAVGEYLILEWNGSVWVTIKATATV